MTVLVLLVLVLERCVIATLRNSTMRLSVVPLLLIAALRSKLIEALPKHFGPGGLQQTGSEQNHILETEEIKAFNSITPEESKNRLAAIFDKIDKDSNGLLTQDELSQWIHYVARRNLREGTQEQWEKHNPYSKTRISWKEYRKSMYGLPLTWEEDKHPQQGKNGDKVNQMIRIDKRRWAAADQDKDELLDVEEFEAFVYPEEKEHMAKVVAQETLEALDKNGDNFVDLNEYIDDIFSDLHNGPWPTYVQEEVELFRNRRDKNSDGRLDLEEMISYTHRSEHDHPEAEAMHLVHAADTDNDTQLSKTEVLNHYDLFVGGQVTNYGEALWSHDEF